MNISVRKLNDPYNSVDALSTFLITPDFENMCVNNAYGKLSFINYLNKSFVFIDTLEDSSRKLPKNVVLTEINQMELIAGFSIVDGKNPLYWVFSVDPSAYYDQSSGGIIIWKDKPKPKEQIIKIFSNDAFCILKGESGRNMCISLAGISSSIA
jgi:hypothetical protein